jgi:hypothetical protein
MIRAQLPKIGEKRLEIPTVDETPGIVTPKKPRECVVVYVNLTTCWYTVQFEDSVRECYKLPRVKTGVNGGILR